MTTRRLILRHGDAEYRADLQPDGAVSIDGTPVPVRAAAPGDVRAGNGAGRRGWVAAAGTTRWVYLDGQVFEIEVQDARRRRPAAHGHTPLSAPMPATVVRVDAAPGAHVRRGDALVVLEAMKMELPVRAPADGVVRAVHCAAGDLVKPGTPLVEME